MKDILTQYILSRKWLNDVNTTNTLGCQGRMVYEYHRLMSEVWIERNKYVNPKR